MNKLKECIEQLKKIDNLPARPKKNRYIGANILKELFETYLTLTDLDRTTFNNSIGLEIGKKLIQYSNTLAARAIDENDLTWIRVGIMAHIWEGFKTDYRDNFFNLVFLYFASEQIRIDFKREIDRLDKFASTQARQMLDSFKSRDSALNSLRSMGIEYQCVNDQSEFRQIG